MKNWQHNKLRALWHHFVEGKPVVGPRNWLLIRFLILVVTDIATIAFSYMAAFALRLDSFWPQGLSGLLSETLPVLVLLSVAVFYFGRLYHQVWRYANLYSSIPVAKCILIVTVLFNVYVSLLGRQPTVPRSIYILFAILSFALFMTIRFAWKMIANRRSAATGPESRISCLIYGAGDAGGLLAHHIATHPRFPYSAKGFIDDSRTKRGRIVHGLPVLGQGADLAKFCVRYDVKTIIVAIPSAPGGILRKIVDLCQVAGVEPLIMPDMATTLGKEIFQPRAIDVKDLLRRVPKAIDQNQIHRYFNKKRILITGAGGSIGSEICRQILTCRPDTMALLDSSEYALYEIDTQLRDLNIPGVRIEPVLGSAMDAGVVRHVFEQFRHEIILHAAAYKHVPLIESNPNVGIVNNLLGTKTVAMHAMLYGSSQFLLISSDKAVRPTSVMGATKRCCELLIQSLQESLNVKCSFSAVRFGNVLGSSGSVIPRFIQQVQTGGPVTVTHPDVTRYFMLTSEAVGLVLQAACLAKGVGEVFVLNMGEPVRIYDMAKQLIKLSGKEPGKDVEIVFTGLRPGEKLFEELLLKSSESHILHDDIFIATPQAIDAQSALAELDRLIGFAQDGDAKSALGILRSLTNAIPGNVPIPGEEREAENLLGGPVAAPAFLVH